MTGNQSPLSFHLAQESVFFHLNWHGESKEECIQRDMMTERHETENKGGYFESYPFFDWQPVKCSKQWSNVFMSALVKNSFSCVALNFLQPVLRESIPVK